MIFTTRWLSLLLAAAPLLANVPAALAAAHVLDQLNASVNSAIILKSDVARFRRVERLRAQLDPLYSGTALASKAGNAPDPEIIEFLIDERLITQQFPVTDAEVEQEISSIQSNNHIDRTQLKNALTQQGFGFEDYFELIRSSASKRNLIDRDIRTKVSIADSDVKNYFYSHYPQDSKGERSYKIRLIFISPKSYKTPAATKDAAMSALKAIRGGEAFEEVAKRTSDDASSSTGGDLGVLTEEQVTPKVREELKKLQIGQVSEIFGTPVAGYYIIKLEDVRSEDSKKLDRVRDEIRNQLLASEYQHQISLWLQRTRQGAFIHRSGEGSTAGLPTKNP